MSTSAHERPCWQSKCAARDIANSLFQKWAIKGFFPAGERSEPRTRTARRATAGRSPRREAGRAASGVAVPLAFFGTFFRFERKYCPPQGGSPSVRAVVGASSSSEGVLMTKLAHIDACRGLSARPLHPFGSPSETNQQPHGAAPTLPRQSQCVSPSPSSCKPPYEW